MEIIREKVQQLAQVNGTTSKSEDVLKFIQANLNKFAEDYKSTSQKDRFSTGKLEKRIFIYLAELCKWNNGNENARIASAILTELGYHSYQKKEKRFRQKVENEKKKMKNSERGKSSARYLKVKSLVKPFKDDDFEDSYSENNYEDVKDIYFPANKVTNCRQNRQQTFEVDNPLHIINNTDTPITRSKTEKDTLPQSQTIISNHNQKLQKINNKDENKEATSGLQDLQQETNKTISNQCNLPEKRDNKNDGNVDYFSNQDYEIKEMYNKTTNNVLKMS